MSAEYRIFVDTNVLIYARDPSAFAKYEIARQWLDRLIPSDRMIVNLQILNELTNWMLRKQKASSAIVLDAITVLREFGETPLSPEDTDLAWDVRERLGYQWFDCLLI